MAQIRNVEIKILQINIGRSSQMKKLWRNENPIMFSKVTSREVKKTRKIGSNVDYIYCENCDEFSF